MAGDEGVSDDESVMESSAADVVCTARAEPDDGTALCSAATADEVTGELAATAA